MDYQYEEILTGSARDKNSNIDTSKRMPRQDLGSSGKEKPAGGSPSTDAGEGLNKEQNLQTGRGIKQGGSPGKDLDTGRGNIGRGQNLDSDSDLDADDLLSDDMEDDVE